jgi:DNA-directed RNA polymerase subunit omega
LGLSWREDFGLTAGPAGNFCPITAANPHLSEHHSSMLPDNVIPFEEVRPVSRFPGSPMKSDLVEKASEIVTDPLVLINLVSQRVRQLNSGRSPLIPTRPSMGVADIALIEIIEGKIRLVEKAEA